MKLPVAQPLPTMINIYGRKRKHRIFCWFFPCFHAQRQQQHGMTALVTIIRVPVFSTTSLGEAISNLSLWTHTCQHGWNTQTGNFGGV